MMHYTQVERKRRIELVSKQLGVGWTIKQIISYWVDTEGVSRRKAIEYLSEVTTE